jgi:hypothetical protein
MRTNTPTTPLSGYHKCDQNPQSEGGANYESELRFWTTGTYTALNRSLWKGTTIRVRVPFKSERAAQRAPG